MDEDGDVDEGTHVDEDALLDEDRLPDEDRHLDPDATAAEVGDGDDGPDTGEDVPTWCPTCRQHVDPGDTVEPGLCPECADRLVVRGPLSWKFKLMVVATVVYLGYRAYQGIGWVIHHA